MPDFTKAKVYKIINDVNGMTYYGSTVQPLSVRMGKHRHAHKVKHSKTYLKFGEISDCKIFLIENFPCNSKDELSQRERFYVENNPCVNKQTPGLTLKESYKKYYINNRVIRRQKADAKNSCECGSIFAHSGKSRHLKTKKHINYCQSLLA